MKNKQSVNYAGEKLRFNQNKCTFWNGKKNLGRTIHICDPMRENPPNCPEVFLSVSVFQVKKCNNLSTSEPILLKFYSIVSETQVTTFHMVR